MAKLVKFCQLVFQPYIRKKSKKIHADINNLFSFVEKLIAGIKENYRNVLSAKPNNNKIVIKCEQVVSIKKD